MDHLFLCKPLPAKRFKKRRKRKKKQKERNPEQPPLSSHNNEKQSGCSVGGDTGPGAEILIKASWHVKSSVIRQPIWVKRAPFWLSHFRPTPERGTTQANKAAGKSRHLFARRDTEHESGRQPEGAIRFHWHVICSGQAGASFTEPRAVAFDPDKTAKQLSQGATAHPGKGR